MKKTSKPIALAMALVVVLSALVVSVFAADETYKHPENVFTLTGGSSTDTAKEVAVGETVFSSVAAGETAYFKFFSSARAEIDFYFEASAKIDVSIAKIDSNVETKLSGDKIYETTVFLDNAYYYIAVTNYAEPVAPPTDESTTEEPTTEEAAPAAKTSAAPTQFTFTTATESLPQLAVKINHSSADLVSGETLQLELTDSSIKNLNWFWRVVDDAQTTVDETKIVTVSKDGLVKVLPNSANFLKDTPVKVQAVMYYAGDVWVKTCTVNAIPANIFLDPYYDTTDAGCLVLGVGATRVISATSNVKDAKITWTSDKPNVVKVNSAGQIEALEAGQAILKVKIDGLEISRRILVDVKANHISVMGIKFESHSAETRVNEDITLKYEWTTAPNNGTLPTNNKVTFTSSNPEIATVNVDGKVEGVGVGKTTITITSEDGGFVDHCEVTVKEAIPNWLMVIIAPLRIIYNLIMMIIGK